MLRAERIAFCLEMWCRSSSRLYFEIEIADIFTISPIKSDFRRYIENIADTYSFSPISKWIVAKDLLSAVESFIMDTNERLSV